jgi:hypothetical protein
MKCLIILSILGFTLAQARADFYQGIRQMGMGGAAIAVVNDETSLLLNPIGLGRLRVPYITLIDPEVTTNNKSVSAVQALALDATNVEEIYSELANQLDDRYFVRTQIFPSYVDRHYGFGFLLKDEISAVRSSTTQFMDVNYVSDLVGVAGFNKSFYGGVFKIGATGRWVDRVQYSGTIDPTTDGLDMKTLAVQGAGLAADVGLSVSSPTGWLPTLSVMLKDVGDTSFSMSSGMRSYLTTDDPTKVPMTMDVAVALFPIWNNYTRGTFTVEYDDVLEDGDAVQKLHAGIEVNLADRFYFRGGYNRGYLTTGFEWNTQFVQLQLAYYGEEIGTEENPQQDERLAFKAVLRF